MKKWALTFFIAAGLGVSAGWADEVVPATGPATEPATTQPADAAPPATGAPATDPVTTSPADVPAVSEAPSSTAPATAPVATTSPTTAPTTSPVATTAPADTQPAPQPSIAVATSRILPREYSILAERSIFQKGSHVTRVVERSRSQPGPSVAAPAPAKAAAMEDSLVFEGATESGDHFLALVEDRTTSKALMFQVGDAIARGRIAAITLDTLDYVATGNVVHVQVGQNLRGETMSPATSDAVASTGSTTAPSTGAPGDGSAAAPGGSGGSNDIVERLRRRRQAELGK